MTVNREALRRRLMREEGTGPVRNGRFFPYTDTLGKLSIGYGYNLTDNGLSPELAVKLLDERIDIAVTGLVFRGAPWFSGLDQVRMQVCCDMAYNLGVDGFFGFHTMVRHLSRGEFREAAAAGRDSDWYHQVGHRAEVLLTMLEAGVE